MTKRGGKRKKRLPSGCLRGDFVASRNLQARLGLTQQGCGFYRAPGSHWAHHIADLLVVGAEGVCGAVGMGG